MLKRPSVLPKSQKTTFYAVFTFVSDVSTFLLVKSGKTALHGRFRSRPSPPPLCSRSRSEAGGCLLPLISALAQAPPPSFLCLPGRRRLLPVASFLSGTLTPPPPGRLLPPLLHCSGAAAGRIAGTRRRRPRTALTPAQTAASPAGPHWRRLRYRYAPSRPSLMCPAREILMLLLCAVQMASSGDVGRANASAESSHRWEIE